MNDFDLTLFNESSQIQAVTDMNRRTEQFGLTLSEDDVHELLSEKQQTLRDERRVELGESVLPKIIDAFCGSPYISQRHYLEILSHLQQIFFEYKNETEDEITDEELLDFMTRHFNGPCKGDLDYLETTCLEEFARALRSEVSDEPE